ncbi:MAG: DcaP family trimeric outer membrane transporter [Gemmatimonadota bacterium]|nr:DcaP family trimeric outer membrane transporter [Gemmatimonadota bacterium]MDH4348346.1 DcaP family trimeric outer membrane transporter [Gemmatimonadota bacterium]MDH5282341.1 DcaP family trimeric outer membrane transporter [Gemmatimonadota bacterium]
MSPSTARSAARLLQPLALLLAVVTAWGGLAPVAEAQVWTFAGKDSVEGAPKTEGFAGFSIRISASEDFFGLQGQSTFNIAEIPPDDDDGNVGGRFSIDARQTRLKAGFTVRGTPLGAIESYLESDFYGPSGQTTLRLRHAYMDFQHFRIGQWWSTFADMDVNPRTADFDGPTTGILVRSAMLRYSTAMWKGTTPTANGTWFTVSLEAPRSDARFSPDTVTSAAFQPLPDLVANVRFQRARGHVQLSAVARDLRYNDGTENQDLFGRGLALSGAIKTTELGSKLMVQLIAGKGIQRYMVSLGGFNIEAVPETPGSTKLTPLPTYGGYLAYDSQWSKKYHSTFVGGATIIPDDRSGSPGPFFRGFYGSANLFWDGAPNLTIGPEILYGVRWNPDDSSSDALRLTILAKYGF